jgi:recombination protein RecA
VLFINQIREKIGVMFGNPETTPGGRALKFYSLVRVDIRRVAAVKENTQVVGNHTRARVVKNKVAPPHRQAEFDILFDRGISKEGDLLDLGCAEEVVGRTGAWYTYGKNRLGQGRENARRFLCENPDIFDEIRAAILGKKGITPKGQPKEAVPDKPTDKRRKNRK